MKPQYKALITLSVAANIFFVAFLAGQRSVPYGFPHKPPPVHFFQALNEKGLLFDEKELSAHFQQMEENFKSRQEEQLRFADLLEKGPVSKIDVLAHLNSLHSNMEEMRNRTSDRIAERISSMDETERRELADFLRKNPIFPPPMLRGNP